MTDQLDVQMDAALFQTDELRERLANGVEHTHGGMESCWVCLALGNVDDALFELRQAQRHLSRRSQ